MRKYKKTDAWYKRTYQLRITNMERNIKIYKGWRDPSITRQRNEAIVKQVQKAIDRNEVDISLYD